MGLCSSQNSRSIKSSHATVYLPRHLKTIFLLARTLLIAIDRPESYIVYGLVVNLIADRG